MDVGVIIAVRGLWQDHTTLPMILAETFISLSFEDRDFCGSSVLLCMTHIGLIGSFSPRTCCLGHDISSRFECQLAPCTDGSSWAEFLSSIVEPYSLLLYTRYCSDLAFLTHAEGLDFIPIVDLRGVTTYHPLAIMAYVDAGIFCYFKNRMGLG